VDRWRAGRTDGWTNGGAAVGSGMSLDDDGIEDAIRQISRIGAELAGLARVADNGLNAVRGARVFDPASRAYTNAVQSGPYSNGAHHVVLEHGLAEAVGSRLVDSARDIRRTDGANAGLLARPGRTVAE
jgi:hypothetical protein